MALSTSQTWLSTALVERRLAKRTPPDSDCWLWILPHRAWASAERSRRSAFNWRKTCKRIQVIIHTTKAMKVVWRMYEHLGFKRSPDLDFMQEELQAFGFRLILEPTTLAMRAREHW